jgi:hypothetical protein
VQKWENVTLCHRYGWVHVAQVDLPQQLVGARLRAAGARVTRMQAGHTLHWRLEVVRASEGGVESIVAGEGVGAGGADEGAWRVT